MGIFDVYVSKDLVMYYWKFISCDRLSKTLQLQQMADVIAVLISFME